MHACMQVLVTDDFASHSPYRGMEVYGLGIRHVVDLLVALNVATTVPLVVLPLEDVLLSVLWARPDATDGDAAGTICCSIPCCALKYCAVIGWGASLHLVLCRAHRRYPSSFRRIFAYPETYMSSRLPSCACLLYTSDAADE